MPINSSRTMKDGQIILAFFFIHFLRKHDMLGVWLVLLLVALFLSFPHLLALIVNIINIIIINENDIGVHVDNHQ